MISVRDTAVRIHWASAVVSSIFAVITIFTRIEDASFGLALWGLFLVVLGTVHTVVLIAMGRPGGWWMWWFGHAVWGVLVGGVTLWFSPSGSVALLLWSIAVWSVVGGSTSIVHGLRQDSTSPARSDWTTLGAGTLLLGFVSVIVPPEVYWLMGVAGVWAAMVTVFVVIAALSARSVSDSDNGGEEQ